MWLARTVADVLEHRQADTEIIVVLDGAWPPQGYELPQHPDVSVVYLPEPIGQRASTNLAARLSEARYVMKLDGHCAVAPGFDYELFRSASELGPDVTQIPAQHNLHVFDWVCGGCSKRTYQGPTPQTCVRCGTAGPFTREIVWNPIRRRTEYWRFDHDLKFQYWGGYKSRPEAQGEIVDVMTALGACFFMSRDRFWQLGGLDEAHGSWGQVGVEVALKSALSGGRHVVNKRTWFSHLFRTQGGDFSFPYQIRHSEQEQARAYSRELWLGNNWPGQVRTFRDYLDQFWPVPGWTEDDRERLAPVRRASAGVVYYTDERGDPEILSACRQQLEHAASSLPIVSTTPKTVGAERGILTMFRQILAGLEALETEIVFFAEHDVLYHPSHFEFMPERSDTYYFNQNIWKVDAATGRALYYRCSQTSGLCANRQLLLGHYRRRIEIVERHGFTRAMGFEPGTHRRKERVDDYPAAVWMSALPNIDIRHRHNLTPSRWRREQFRNQKFTDGWTEGDGVPGWGTTLGRFDDFLREVGRETQQAVA